METAGQQRVIRAEDVAVMGITEIVRHVPRILVAYRKLVRSLQRDKPDVAVLIDFPDVNFRLAKHLRKMGVPVFWFVSPQLWAWKRRRLRWVQQRVSKMFVIFPFEQEFYKNRGVDAIYTGHPLADLPTPEIDRQHYADVSHIDPAKPWIALLPGSRRKEIAANLPEMLKAAQQLGPQYEYLLPIAPTLEHQAVQNMVEDWSKVYGTRNILPKITLVHDARAALQHARASVVASGTATVQAALIGNPFIVVYRVSDTTFRLAKLLIRYPAEIPTPVDEHGHLPIAMPNLIAGKRIVPELINKNMTSSNITKTLKPLLEETPERAAQMEALCRLRSLLKIDPEKPAIHHLRDAVLHVVAPSL